MPWYSNTGLVLSLIGGSTAMLFVLLVLLRKWGIRIESEELKIYEALAEETGYNKSKAEYERIKQGR